MGFLLNIRPRPEIWRPYPRKRRGLMTVPDRGMKPLQERLPNRIAAAFAPLAEALPHGIARKSG